MLRLDKAQAQQRILEVLHGSDSALKPVAIANVRALPSTNASEVFAGALANLTSQEQVWMIDSLAARGDAPACTAIGNSLASPDAGCSARGHQRPGPHGERVVRPPICARAGSLQGRSRNAAPLNPL